MLRKIWAAAVGRAFHWNEARLKLALGVDTLRGADLRGWDLHNADLKAADLREADLSSASLAGADLSNADMRGAKLVEVYFGSAISNDAKFNDADFASARMPGMQLWRADFTGAKNLTAQECAYAWINPTTILPEGVTLDEIRSLRPKPTSYRDSTLGAASFLSLGQ